VRSNVETFSRNKKVQKKAKPLQQVRENFYGLTNEKFNQNYDLSPYSDTQS